MFVRIYKLYTSGCNALFDFCIEERPQMEIPKSPFFKVEILFYYFYSQICQTILIPKKENCICFTTVSF